MHNPHFFASQIPHPFHTVLISRKRSGMSYAVMQTVTQDTSDIENMSNEEVNAIVRSASKNTQTANIWLKGE